MLVAAVVLAVFAVIFWESRVFRKQGFSALRYVAFFSSSEVNAGDDVYLYEEIINTGKYPITYLKADTELPPGLQFTLFESTETPRNAGGKRSGTSGTGSAGKETAGEMRRIRYSQNIQSVFVIRPGMKVRRRWRVSCRTRGEYGLQGVLLTRGDILGFHKESIRIPPEAGKRTVLTVLPVPEVLEEHYASSRFLCGEIVSPHCPITDPLRICGTREYSVGDPMNRINWKSTAAHGKMMVNIEEKTVRHRFSVLLNMNSKEIEYIPDKPSDTSAVERSITVCASVLERMAQDNVPMRLYLNASPDRDLGLSPLEDGTDGSRISRAGPFVGKRDMIFALRTLAKLPMAISLPAEKMFDCLAAHPELYSENENLVVISAYLDARMLLFHDILARQGVKVSFYITSSRNLIGNIPAGTDAYFHL